MPKISGIERISNKESSNRIGQQEGELVKAIKKLAYKER